ncbi:septal ring lytic transglycosylase RlpA family protein [Deefgea piscis]|uniref:Endolytic peptidoglycan transglycosylase RlpA n=2 Tax=Deefgea piscis TaxID=2739061 RepID=A0A6M8SLG7_9NEIS|nr:septal ring lytic transglycosylase RlpA family protein [Deefgea piscis]QKJ66005.1 septal ring lytic transglycosylase RlpA family protein [Deefgea piscis]
MKLTHSATLVCASLLLAACSSTPEKPTPRPVVPAPTQPSTITGTPSPYNCSYKASSGNGAFYKDDGPMADFPANLDQVLEPIPRWETPHKWANRPYTVLGLSFTPHSQIDGYKEQGIASWYGRKFHGQKTSIGETYDMFQMTAAHPTLSIPSYARVTNVKNGRSVIVRVNDRGPFHKGRVMDLSFLAACRLGYANNGSAEVIVESLMPSDAPSDIIANAKVAVHSTPAPVSNKPRPIPVAESNGKVFVQLGAFSSQSNAESFKAHVARELDQDSDKLSIQSSSNLFRVRLGPFASRSEAMTTISRVTGEKNIQAVISQ